MEHQLRQAVATGAREIVVRLGADDANADTLSFLRDVSSSLRRVGGRLVVVSDDPVARRLLGLTFLDQAAVRGTHPARALAGEGGEA